MEELNRDSLDWDSLLKQYHEDALRYGTELGELRKHGDLFQLETSAFESRQNDKTTKNSSNESGPLNYATDLENKRLRYINMKNLEELAALQQMVNVYSHTEKSVANYKNEFLCLQQKLEAKELELISMQKSTEQIRLQNKKFSQELRFIEGKIASRIEQEEKMVLEIKILIEKSWKRIVSDKIPELHTLLGEFKLQGSSLYDFITETIDFSDSVVDLLLKQKEKEFILYESRLEECRLRDVVEGNESKNLKLKLMDIEKLYELVDQLKRENEDLKSQIETNNQKHFVDKIEEKQGTENVLSKVSNHKIKEIVTLDQGKIAQTCQDTNINELQNKIERLDEEFRLAKDEIDRKNIIIAKLSKEKAIIGKEKNDTDLVAELVNKIEKCKRELEAAHEEINHQRNTVAKLRQGDLSASKIQMNADLQKSIEEKDKMILFLSQRIMEREHNINNGLENVKVKTILKDIHDGGKDVYKETNSTPQDIISLERSISNIEMKIKNELFEITKENMDTFNFRNAFTLLSGFIDSTEKLRKKQEDPQIKRIFGALEQFFKAQQGKISVELSKRDEKHIEFDKVRDSAWLSKICKKEAENNDLRTVIKGYEKQFSQLLLIAKQIPNLEVKTPILFPIIDKTLPGNFCHPLPFEHFYNYIHAECESANHSLKRMHSQFENCRIRLKEFEKRNDILLEEKKISDRKLNDFFCENNLMSGKVSKLQEELETLGEQFIHEVNEKSALEKKLIRFTEGFQKILL